MNHLLFRVIKEMLKYQYDHSFQDGRDFWTWVAEEFPDTYDVCLELTNNLLHIRE